MLGAGAGPVPGRGALWGQASVGATALPGAGLPRAGMPGVGILGQRSQVQESLKWGSQEPGSRRGGGSGDPRNQDAGGEDARSWVSGARGGAPRSGVPGMGMLEEEIQERGPRSEEGTGVPGPRCSPCRGGPATPRTRLGWGAPGEEVLLGHCGGTPGAGGLGRWRGVGAAVPGGLRYRPARISFDDFVRFRLISFDPSRRRGAGPGRGERTHPRGSAAGRGDGRGPGRGVPSRRGMSPPRPLPGPPWAPRDSRLR